MRLYTFQVCQYFWLFGPFSLAGKKYVSTRYAYFFVFVLLFTLNIKRCFFFLHASSFWLLFFMLKAILSSRLFSLCKANVSWLKEKNFPCFLPFLTNKYLYILNILYIAKAKLSTLFDYYEKGLFTLKKKRRVGFFLKKFFKTLILLGFLFICPKGKIDFENFPQNLFYNCNDFFWCKLVVTVPTNKF